MTNNEFKPQAYITLSNSGGIELMVHNSGDGVYYRYNYGQDLTNEEIFEAPIVYLSPESEDGEGNTGFYHNEDESIFYSLNEAMRIN